MAKFDPSVPSIARIYDYVLGGKDNFPADRAQADKALAYNPLIPVMARENRQFLSRAVGWVARQGIDQFIDIGCGLPTQPNTHESARAVRPEAMVAYVDNDPVVIGHLNALVAKSSPGIGVLAGDVREPDRVLNGVADTTDLAKPAGLILGSLLHFISPDEARDLVTRYAAALAVSVSWWCRPRGWTAAARTGVTANTQGTSPRSTTTRPPTSPGSSARSNCCHRASSTPAAGTRRWVSRPPRRRATPTCSPRSPGSPVRTHWIIPNRLRLADVLQPGAPARVGG